MAPVARFALNENPLVCPSLSAGAVYTERDHRERYAGAYLIGATILARRLDCAVLGKKMRGPTTRDEEVLALTQILRGARPLTEPVSGRDRGRGRDAQGALPEK